MNFNSISLEKFPDQKIQKLNKSYNISTENEKISKIGYICICALTMDISNHLKQPNIPKKYNSCPSTLQKNKKKKGKRKNYRIYVLQDIK
jgi:hypothetical protein